MNFSRKLIFIIVIIFILAVSVVVFVVFYSKIFKTKEIKIQPAVKIQPVAVSEEKLGSVETEQTVLLIEPEKPVESTDVAQEEIAEDVAMEAAGMETEKVSMVSPDSPFLFNIFGKATVAPDFSLNGAAKNIDSPEFFETANYNDTLLLVSGKSNNVIEVWRYPFIGNEQKSLKRDTLPNGLAIDQKRDWLLVGDAEEKKVEIYSLPKLNRVKTIGKGKLESGETNLDVFDRSDGGATYFVSESHKIRGFDADSGNQLVFFEPRVASIEELVVDDYHGVIYIPDEEGVESVFYKGGAVTAYNPAGKKYFKNGANVFARGVFQGDGEGATIYKCLGANKRDTGRGFLIFVDQAGSRQNGLEFFNRETWKHLGTLTLSGVSMSDGVASIQTAFPRYPSGLLAITDNDTTTAIISWSKIFAVTGLDCNKSQ